ncbi:glycosyltransferase family A protein [Pedobacter aquatilis]|uniref:glycosyltransferase family 2 protein n=1 Tax=Pedobacter aquatilis TaxID=351343 RepID=UPI0029304A97|nr:glycosyltransferase family A protein [Pedobacter aquatilis]
MKKSTYSLLVPCYNAEPYIGIFLDNISQLDEKFDEVLFYDDASEDNTLKLLEQKGCTVIRGLVNKGPGFARNKLAEATTCNWIHFHDIDDLLDNQYLSKVRSIAEVGAVEIVLCNVVWYDHLTKQEVISWKYSNSLIQADPVRYTIANPIGGINGLYQRIVFLKINGFNPLIRIWEDADLHVRLALNGSKFHVVEENLSFSIRYPFSASSNQKLAWLIRANLLWEYYERICSPVQLIELGREAQKVASFLILAEQYNEARMALKLSELCNLKVPNSEKKIWKLLKVLLPAHTRINLRLLQLKFAFKAHNTIKKKQ